MKDKISEKAKSLIDTIFDCDPNGCLDSTPEVVKESIIIAAKTAMRTIPHPEAPTVIAEIEAGSCDWYINALLLGVC